MPLLSRFGIAQRLYAVIAVLTIALVGVALFATSRLNHVVTLADTTERTRGVQRARQCREAWPRPARRSRRATRT
jgi:hypothetical protein